MYYDVDRKEALSSEHTLLQQSSTADVAVELKPVDASVSRNTTHLTGVVAPSSSVHHQRLLTLPTTDIPMCSIDDGDDDDDALIRLQQRTHDKSLRSWKRRQIHLKAWKPQPLFGVPLNEINRWGIKNPLVPLVVEKIVLELLEHSMEVEGLFRVNGRATVVQACRLRYDMGMNEKCSTDRD